MGPIPPSCPRPPGAEPARLAWQPGGGRVGRRGAAPLWPGAAAARPLGVARAAGPRHRESRGGRAGGLIGGPAPPGHARRPPIGAASGRPGGGSSNADSRTAAAPRTAARHPHGAPAPRGACRSTSHSPEGPGRVHRVWRKLCEPESVPHLRLLAVPRPARNTEGAEGPRVGLFRALGDPTSRRGPALRPVRPSDPYHRRGPLRAGAVCGTGP
jgi:hypothetical protein